MAEDVEENKLEVPVQAQPKDSELSFNLDDVLDSVVLVRAEVPEDAFTAQILGMDRTGSGVVISDSGLILTVGYIITEAEQIWLTANDGITVKGDVVAYDHDSGFGLLQSLGSLGVPSVKLGNASMIDVGEPVVVVGAGGRKHSLYATVSSRRAFVGSWEYALDEAIFSAPVHPNWAGTALFDMRGHLVGIGSLFVQNAGSSEIDGNMSIPIDLYKSIAESMKSTSSSGNNPRPWLGIYVADGDDSVLVAGMVSFGPAAKAGFKVGDEILQVGTTTVTDLHHFYRLVWSEGSAGVEILIKIRREKSKIIELSVKSIDRKNVMRKPVLHS
tara:strand:- start:117 stop:1103 length:987 start_codon:yes stop_codon:yes gene_type:complete